MKGDAPPQHKNMRWWVSCGAVYFMNQNNTIRTLAMAKFPFLASVSFSHFARVRVFS